jgi:hypothetical protein
MLDHLIAPRREPYRAVTASRGAGTGGRAGQCLRRCYEQPAMNGPRTIQAFPGQGKAGAPPSWSWASGHAGSRGPPTSPALCIHTRANCAQASGVRRATNARHALDLIITRPMESLIEQYRERMTLDQSRLRSHLTHKPNVALTRVSAPARRNKVRVPQVPAIAPAP